jgi:excisionase family DNA binding protein
MTMTTMSRTITGRAPDTVALTVSVRRACQLTGLGATTIWALLRAGRLRAVRIAGLRRTLIDANSLCDLLAVHATSELPHRGRPRRGASTVVR